MRYRTIIEIITEANNKNEALNIAGEFLNGNIESDVKIKCRTNMIKSHGLLKASIALRLIAAFIAGIVSFGYFKSVSIAVSGAENVSVFQTFLKAGQNVEFKENWQEEENKKVLDYRKKGEQVQASQKTRCLSLLARCCFLLQFSGLVIK